MAMCLGDDPACASDVKGPTLCLATTREVVNPAWITAHMLLRATQQSSKAETCFDVRAALDAAATCNDSVTKLAGAGNETQACLDPHRRGAYLCAPARLGGTSAAAGCAS